MTTLFEMLKERESVISLASPYRLMLSPDWACDLSLSKDVMWHRDHGDVYEIKMRVRSARTYYHIDHDMYYFSEQDRYRMQKLNPLCELVDPDGSELLLQTSLGKKGYIRLLSNFGPPENVERLLEGMGHKLTSRSLREGYTCYLRGGSLGISPDTALYPVWEPSHLREDSLRGHHGSENARSYLDEQRRSLDVYDTLLRTCYS